MSKTLLFFWEVLKIVLLALLIVLPIRYFIFQPFIVKGVSMEPTFHNGDYLIIDEISYRFKQFERGEVIVFQYPKNPQQKFIKRIIGLPGEEIELENGQIVIRSPLGEETVLDESTYIPVEELAGEAKISLGENEYFVLGDNRNHSFDSRTWGGLREELIIGRVFLRVFPPRAAAFFPAPTY